MFLLRLLRGAAMGLGAGFILFMVVASVVAAFTADEGWIYAVFFGGAAFAVYVMPIVGVLVELVIMIRRAAGH